MKEIGCDVCRVKYVERNGQPMLTVSDKYIPDYAFAISKAHAQKMIALLFKNLDADTYMILHSLIAAAFLSGWNHAIEDVNNAIERAKNVIQN